MSSIKEKSGFDVNETQVNGVSKSIKNDTDFSQDPSFSSFNNIGLEEQLQKNNENQEYQTSDHGANSESENSDDEVDEANFGSELTHDIKMKLIYSDAPLSDDHLFWVHTQHSAVVNLRKSILELKNKIEKARSQGEFNNKDHIKNLEEMEQEFISKHIKRVIIDENLPKVEPLADDIRSNIYSMNKEQKERPHYFKVITSAPQIRMAIQLKHLRKAASVLQYTTDNKFMSDVHNYLYHKEREYKEKFMIPKTSEELEEEQKTIEEQKKNALLLDNPNKPWIQELTIGNKKQLMYTRAAFTDDHLFWVDINNRGVKDTKWKLFKLKQIFHKAIATGVQENITATELEFRAKERYFVNQFVQKIQFDESLPTIDPMPRGLRNAIYDDTKSNIYKVSYSTEQKEMLKEMKLTRKHLKKLVTVRNKFAPNIANQLYHKEFDYKKRFLTINPETEQKMIDDEANRKPRVLDVKLAKIKQIHTKKGNKNIKNRAQNTNAPHKNSPFPQRNSNTYPFNQGGFQTRYYESQTGYNQYQNNGSKYSQYGYNQYQNNRSQYPQSGYNQYQSNRPPSGWKGSRYAPY